MELPAKERRTATVKLGKLTLTGVRAVIALLVLLGLVVALLFYVKPSLGMLLSGGIWVAFIVYWGAASQKPAPARSFESASSSARHQLLMNIGLLLLLVPVPGLRWRYLTADLHVPVGLAVQCAFAWLYIWARSYLGRYWSSAVRVRTDHQLIRSGPYRVVRHPLYTAMLGMAVGTAIVSGQPHGLLGVATFAFAYWRKIELEERSLAETFGAEYEMYRKKSWALIPWLF